MKTNMKTAIVFLVISMSFIFACKQQKKVIIVREQPVRLQPKTITYQIANAKQWLLADTTGDSSKLQIILAINRADKAAFAKMDTVIIPTDMTGDIAYYLPFPLNVPYLADINKIIFFSYPTQTFGTYENGILMYTGPTNMGSKKHPTPTGLFYANWKAEETISTFNDEWELKWNFNIENKEGVGWHQYAMPGYPASHSCLRLQEKDAKHLYEWAEQWILDGKEIVLANGTPVIVFGNYNFDAPKPWLQLISNPHALDITEAEIQKQTTTYLTAILAEQQKRETVAATKQ